MLEDTRRIQGYCSSWDGLAQEREAREGDDMIMTAANGHSYFLF